MIVLETGLGDSSLAWSLVQPKLATTTRVCSYDRSGELHGAMMPGRNTASRRRPTIAIVY